MKHRGETKERRTRKGLHWEMFDTPKVKGQISERSSWGFNPDNYATISLEEAEDDFAQMFVEIRQILENNDSLCMDDEEDRLNLCQKLTRLAVRNSKKDA